MAGLATSKTVAIGAFVVLAGATAWYLGLGQSRTHIPANVVYEYRTQFSPGQLAPGWTLLSVGPNVDDPTKIIHRVEVPPALAGELVMLSGSRRARRVGGVACPDAAHPIWTKISRLQDIQIELYTDKGTFDTISCRSAVL